MLLERKVRAFEKKETAKRNRTLIIDFFKGRHAKNPNGTNALLQSLAKIGTKKSAIDNGSTFWEYELKQHLLSHEKVLIEAKLQK